MTELQALEQETGFKKVECSCNTCVSMCKTSPCAGTPLDILKLIDAGYEKYLSPTLVIAPQVMAYFGKPINIIALEFDHKKGSCCMLDDYGKCKLHASGLKPSEGKLATCNKDNYDKGILPPIIAVLRRWEHIHI